MLVFLNAYSRQESGPLLCECGVPQQLKRGREQLVRRPVKKMAAADQVTVCLIYHGRLRKFFPLRQVNA